ncbi:MAG: FGGY family carbohydrate kinase, partial [Pseudomonadota bacterium]|nr:FGGY family carbohydrate kinase [Pseudomonadota bacterium]
IDQGTTSSRAILFNEDGTILAQQSAEFPQHFPADGWVEHDPEDIWQTTVDVTSAMVAEARSRGSMPLAIGITNQRETAIIWDRATGKPIHNAIVWQDRRTADICAVMKNAGSEAIVTEKTGLLLDPYFSASKIRWMLDHYQEAQAAAASDDLCFGTVESWLLWQLTGGQRHGSDMSNASRTLLMDLEQQRWVDDFREPTGLPANALPEL